MFKLKKHKKKHKHKASKKKEKEVKPEKEGKPRCAYKKCKKKKDLDICPYCNNLFCPKHLYPKTPGMPLFKGVDIEDKRRMQAGLKQEGHSCVEFVVHWEDERKKKQLEYGEKIEKIITEKPREVAMEMLDEMVMTPEPEFEKKVKQEEKHEKKAKVKKHKRTAFIIIGFLIIFLFVAFYIFTYFVSLEESYYAVSKTITKEQVLTEKIQEEISFEEYFADREKYDGKEVNMIGYLHNKLEGTGKAGKYVDYLVDDKGRKVELKDIDGEYKLFFVKKGITEDVYSVSGTLKRIYQGFEMIVDQINQSEKPIVEKQNTVMVEENVTEQKKKPFTLNASLAVNRLKEFFD